MSERALQRAQQLVGDQCDPVVLINEVSRTYPSLDLDTAQAVQLDLAIMNCFTNIVTQPEVSGRQVFEDVVWGANPSGSGMLRKSADDSFYLDEPHAIPLRKSNRLAILEKFKEKVNLNAIKREKIDAQQQKLRKRREEIAQENMSRFGKINKEEMKLQEERNKLWEETNQLTTQVDDAIDTWCSSMDTLVKDLMGRMKLEQIGEFISQYSNFKRELKSAVNRVRWDIEDETREKVKNKMVNLRTLGKSQTGHRGFNYVGFRNLESTIWDNRFDKVQKGAAR